MLFYADTFVISKKRFEDALKKLKTDLETRLAQREQLTQRKRAEAEKRARMELGEDGNPSEGDEDFDGLFGEDDDDKLGDGGDTRMDGPSGISPTARRRMASEGADSPSLDMMEIG